MLTCAYTPCPLSCRGSKLSWPEPARRTGRRRKGGRGAGRRRADEHVAELQAGQRALQRVRGVVDQVRLRLARRARQEHVLHARAP
jgi:hypothetical protein